MLDALTRWRAALSAEGRLSAAQIDELEAHVLDAMDELPAELDAEEKVLVATHRLGQPARLGEEFAKVTPWTSWRGAIFWAAAGVLSVLGVEAILDLAVQLGALAGSRLGLPAVWLTVWAFVACVGGPIIAFVSVGAWMRRYPASHPRSRIALFAMLASAALLRLGSVPLIARLNATAWRGFAPDAARSFLAAWQTALMLGFVLVAAVGALALVRFRNDPRARS